MEDQHMYDITINPQELPQESCTEDVTPPLILSRKKRSSVKWSELPRTVLEKIYSYLDKRDRSQMSLVCRKWYQEYSAPCLWRTMKISLPQTSAPRNVCQAVRFARKYGHAFRHVEIECKTIEANCVSVMREQLTQILEALTSSSQISSISFIYLCRYFDHLNQNAVGNIFQKIKLFLLSQNNVESVRFQNSYFRNLQALEIVRTIFAKDNGTLKHLTLEGFSDDTLPDDFRGYVNDVPSTYDILMNLRKLEIDYSHMLENLMTSCFEYEKGVGLFNKMGKLEEMKINCIDIDWDDYQGISPDVWKYFTEKCPSLRIKLFYHDVYEDENRFDTFIVRNMPIKLLDFQCEVYNNIGIRRLLTHIVSCEINIFLEEVNITWMQNTRVFVSDLINFLEAFPRLSMLQLKLKHPAEGLDILFSNLLYSRPPSLEIVNINITNIPAVEDEFYYLDIADYFSPLLQVISLALFLHTEIS